MKKHISCTDSFTRHQKVGRYRRLLHDATNEERRGYLRRLLDEAQQKQKDSGDPKYQY
jgi:hypothetical protein